MNKLKKYLLTTGVMLWCTFSWSQNDTKAPKYSNEFLQIGVSADALGFGNAVVADIDNVHASYWNPAGLTEIKDFMQASFMHAEYFAGIAKYDYLGWAMPLDSMSTIGATIIRFGVDNIPNTTQLIDNNGNIDYDRITTFSAADYALLFSYARKLKVPGLSIGGNFKVIYRQIGDFADSWGFGIDAGIQYKLKKNWRFGLMMRDVTSTFNAWFFNLDDNTKEVFEATGNVIPENGLELTMPRIILGAQGRFKLGKGFYTKTEIDVSFTTDGRRNVLFRTSPVSIDPYAGVEVGFKEFVAVRAGFGNFQWVKKITNGEQLTFQPNVGIGVGFKGVHIDYAYTDIGDQSTALYSHVISLRVDINKKEK